MHVMVEHKNVDDRSFRLLREWVIYCHYFGAKKPPIILPFIIHKSACDRWAFLQMKITLLRMNKKLRFNIKFIVFLVCGGELHKMMELAK
jgi:hypothetical protein